MTVRHDLRGNLPARRSRERRVWMTGFLLSLAIHLMLLLVGPLGSVPLSPFSAVGEELGDDQAAEGFLEVVALSSAPADAAQPIPIPVLNTTLPEPEIVEADAMPEIALDPPDLPEPGAGGSVGDDRADQADVGIAGGVGLGDAGTVDEGRSRLIPPSPRGMIMPPTNRELRGREIEVWVFVNENGRVIPDSTRLQPPTADRRFNEQLARDAADWIFDPARQDGQPVAAWFPYLISM